MKHVSMLTVRRRLIIVFFLLAVYFLIMFGRLAFVQLVSGDEIMESAEICGQEIYHSKLNVERFSIEMVRC